MARAAIATKKYNCSDWCVKNEVLKLWWVAAWQTEFGTTKTESPTISQTSPRTKFSPTFIPEHVGWRGWWLTLRKWIEPARPAATWLLIQWFLASLAWDYDPIMTRDTPWTTALMNTNFPAWHNRVRFGVVIHYPSLSLHLQTCSLLS